jgi:hypothetical protein
MVAPASREYLPTEDPVTARAWARIARGTRDDVEAAVGSAKRAFETGAWPGLSPSERGRLLWKLGDEPRPAGHRRPPGFIGISRALRQAQLLAPEQHQREAAHRNRRQKQEQPVERDTPRCSKHRHELRGGRRRRNANHHATTPTRGARGVTRKRRDDRAHDIRMLDMLL